MSHLVSIKIAVKVWNRDRVTFTNIALDYECTDNKWKNLLETSVITRGKAAII